MYGALHHSLGAPLHRSFLPLNLHSARVRRNRGRLPSSRCIESARTHRARAPALPARASDTTLGLLARVHSVAGTPRLVIRLCMSCCRYGVAHVADRLRRGDSRA